MSEPIRDLQEKLTDAFIQYQYRLDNPMPSPTETKALMIAAYRSDPVFYAKVHQLTASVTYIVEQWLTDAAVRETVVRDIVEQWLKDAAVREAIAGEDDE